MTQPQRLAVLALAASIAACGDDAAVPPGLLLSEPSAVAVFRGNVTSRTTLQPFIAIANAASNDLTIVDAVTDVGVPAPVPLRTLVAPVPGRPTLLASADLGDGKADLLVAVSAGDSRLQVIRTWDPDLAITAEVPLSADVLALTAVPSSAPEQARIAAALSGERIAVVTFGRAADDSVIVLATHEAGLGFQPVALAAMLDDPTRIWAATPDVDGVVQIGIDANGVPSEGPLLNAGAPTRLVAAARLAAERGPGEGGLDPATWATTALPGRVYAVLDESGCGLDAPISCGLVALDADGAGLARDFVNPANPRAPIPIPGRALALAASGPPARAPSDAAADQIYAPPFMRMVTSLGARRTTGAAAVASTDGGIYFVDLGRWELPSNQVVHSHVGITKVTSNRAPGSAVDQWLLPARGDGLPVSHLDPTGLVTVTPGFTPTARWTITYEGVLPGLASRRAESGEEAGAPWLALQVGVPGVSEIVRLYDPMVGVRGGDTIVVDPMALPSCGATFEARVDPAAPFLRPDADRPGGAVRLVAKGDPAHPEWDTCVEALRTPALETSLRATFRGGGEDPYVVIHRTGTSDVYAGRANVGEELRFAPSSEDAFPACVLPPAAPWDPAELCEEACRADCESLLKAHLARRIGYVPESCASDDTVCQTRWSGGVTDVVGPALALTLALEDPAVVPPPRDLALVIETQEGRSPARGGDPLGAAIDARSAVAFDRSPYPGSQAAGIRFLVPYASGVVLDTSPTNGSTGALR